KAEAGKAWVKGKAEAGKKWVKGKLSGVDQRTDAEKRAAVHQAVLDSNAVLHQKDITPERVKAQLAPIRSKHRLAALLLHDLGEGKFRVEAKINPEEWTPPTLLQGLQFKEAERLITKAREAEPSITGLVRTLAAAHGGSLQGYEYRIKTRESLTDKLNRDSDPIAPHKVKEVGGALGDVLRYTIQLPIDKYANGHDLVLAALKSAGHKVVEDSSGQPKDKNFWWQDGKIGQPNERAYRGYNVQLRSQNGQVWELQFHTRESLQFKGKGSHHEYEEIRRIEANQKKGLATPEDLARVDELKERLLKMARAIPVPKGVLPASVAELDLT
ncbi:MAG: hypothetical protein WAS02_01595, partial [Propionicimonas sp.]